MDAGAFAQLTCAVSHGDMPITITWSLKGQELNSGPSIVTTMVGTRTSMLIISSVDYSHVGEYTCRASNPAGSVTHSANLVVNGNCGEETGTGKYHIAALTSECFRTTQYCSLLIWKRRHRLWGLCPTDLRCIPWRHAHHHHLEPQGHGIELRAQHHHNHARPKS